MDGLDRRMNTLTTVIVLTSLSLPQHTHGYSGSEVWHYIERAESPDTADWIWKFTTRAANSVMTTSILSILASSGLDCWTHDQLEVFNWGQCSHFTARLFISSYTVTFFIYFIFSCSKQTKQKTSLIGEPCTARFPLPPTTNANRPNYPIVTFASIFNFRNILTGIASAPLCFPLAGKFIL